MLSICRSPLLGSCMPKPSPKCSSTLADVADYFRQHFCGAHTCDLKQKELLLNTIIKARLQPLSASV